MVGTDDLTLFTVTALARSTARHLLALRGATLFAALSGRLAPASR
jgi:hypothetical protein